MKLLRKVWCLLVHRRVAAFARWTLRPDGTFQRHCARCEYGWSWPQTFGVIDVTKMPASRAPPKRYSGPVELVNGRWQPLRAEPR